ncbi:hypothetical protein FVR03_16745 [Pontibacter qinzhouensis]|uniref:Uncharacterized protein n=1 Tax=Pontibacter qinzhouensis TaxID=2603253 RepID=A0A5C8JEK1_9BACT|nr:hypothetical protein [Pontibacter qinzhouensis]TXK36790.1 hypothetical protein FVR03_16745 [Pontibacter qinzhouensis]
MRITNFKTYTVAEPLQDPVEISFMNQKGSFDTVQFTKYKDTEYSFKTSLYGSNGANKAYAVSSTQTVTYYSPYLDEATYRWLIVDLLHSPAIYIDGKYVKKVDHSEKYENSQDLYTIELTVSPEYEQNYISL